MCLFAVASHRIPSPRPRLHLRGAAPRRRRLDGQVRGQVTARPAASGCACHHPLWLRVALACPLIYFPRRCANKVIAAEEGGDLITPSLARRCGVTAWARRSTGGDGDATGGRRRASDGIATGVRRWAGDGLATASDGRATMGKRRLDETGWCRTGRTDDRQRHPHYNGPHIIDGRPHGMCKVSTTDDGKRQ